MSGNADAPSESGPTPPANVSDGLAARLTELDAGQLRAVISYAESLLPPAPTPASLIEERPGERILDVSERDGHTEVVKEQPCAEGCEDCPHGPYLYRIRVQPPIGDESEPTLHWNFLGLVHS